MLQHTARSLRRAPALVAACAAILVALAPVTAPAQGNDGYTLDEAVAAARQRTGGKVLRAQTKSANGRKVHEIRVLTKNSHVRTLRFKGKRGNGKGD